MSDQVPDMLRQLEQLNEAKVKQILALGLPLEGMMLTALQVRVELLVHKLGGPTFELEYESNLADRLDGLLSEINRARLLQGINPPQA